MRQFTFLPIAILALNTGSEAEEKAILKAHGFSANKPLEGHYKGEQEQAWLVCLSGQEDRRKLVELAREYKQESVLFSGIDRTSVLYFVGDGHEEIVGVLTEVHESIAKEKDAYTFDPQSGKYFLTV